MMENERLKVIYKTLTFIREGFNLRIYEELFLLILSQQNQQYQKKGKGSEDEKQNSIFKQELNPQQHRMFVQNLFFFDIKLDLVYNITWC